MKHSKHVAVIIILASTVTRGGGRLKLPYLASLQAFGVVLADNIAEHHALIAVVI